HPAGGLGGLGLAGDVDAHTRALGVLGGHHAQVLGGHAAVQRNSPLLAPAGGKRMRDRKQQSAAGKHGPCESSGSYRSYESARPRPIGAIRPIGPVRPIRPTQALSSRPQPAAPPPTQPSRSSPAARSTPSPRPGTPAAQRRC